MFSSIRRLASIFAIGLAACASAVDDCLYKLKEATIRIVDTVLDFGISLVARAASTLPSLTAKQPTGTAAERTRLIPSQTYARTQDARRSPNIQPGWRLCTST